MPKEHSYLKIRKAGCYSIIADETADVSHQEQLIVYIRWIDDEFEIHAYECSENPSYY